MFNFDYIKKTIRLVLFVLGFCSTIHAQTSSLVYLGNDGKLVYEADSLGNVVPDFSGVGYMNSDESIPTVPVVKTVAAVTGDNLANIQSAIDEVAAMPVNFNGFRGAILFEAGEYEISDAVNINTSGIVLRGEGVEENGTHFIATKTAQHSLLYFSSSSGRSTDESSAKQIVDNYVPIGAKQVTVETGHNFEVGEWVLLRRSPKQSWIDLLNTAQYGWTASGYVVNYERQITQINGDVIYLDAPVMDVIDPQYADGYLVKYTSGRIEKCGIENMRISSTYTSESDENHGWTAVEFNNAINGWARNLDIYYFGYSAVWMRDPSRHITVDNCRMIDPKSVTTGGRKYSFNVDGQRCLVQNCFTKGGRHDYVNGSQTAGPSVFYNCIATEQHADIGPHHRWSTGILFDNIVGNGAINVQNRTSSGSGHGWAGSQIMFWNCQGNKLICQDPPSGHRNWAIGCIGNVTNNGDWVTEPLGIVEHEGTHVIPASLFMTQLEERVIPTSAPAAPTNLNAVAESSTKISLSWTDNADNEKLTRIERSNDSGSTWISIDSVNINITTYIDTGLVPSTAYYYRVRAENILGNSDYSDTTNATTVQALPIAVPTDLAAIEVTVDRVDLSWTDNSNNEDNFRIERSTGEDTTWILLINTAINITDYSDTGLLDSTTYRYRVRAENAFGSSDYSNTITVTTQHKEEGDNLALNRPVRFSTQQMEGGSGDNPASNAVDGDINTRWSTARDSTWPQWIEVDLGTVRTINKTEVICFSDRAYQFTLDVASDTNGVYTQVVDRTGNTTPGAVESPIIDTFGPVDTRYVRITVTGAHEYGGPWTSIIESRIFNSSEVVDVEEAYAVPSDFKLFQNYPNPFNPTTVISYQVPVGGLVTLKVYDILGKEIATLVNEQKSAGTHKIDFDAAGLAGRQGLASGVYLYRMHVYGSGNNEFIQTKKMLLLK